MTSPVVLVLNSGSSSLKYQLIEPDSGRSLADGIVEQIGEPASPVADHAAALAVAFEKLSDDGIELTTCGLAAVGHRVVHGGRDLLPADCHRRRGRRRAQGVVGAGPAAQSARGAGHRGGPQDAAGGAARRGVRHRVLPRPARRRGDLRDRPGAGGEVADPAVRISRDLAPLRQRTGRGFPGPAVERTESDCAASG